MISQFVGTLKSIELKNVKLEISIASSQWENTVPPIAVKVFKKNLPGFEVSVKKSLLVAWILQ